MRTHPCFWKLVVVCCGLLTALVAPQPVAAQTLEVTGVWFEITADREDQLEFYAYSSGQLVGSPGNLDGVLISSCPWTSDSGLLTYCGAGAFYQPPFVENQRFECNSPNCTELGTVQKPPCSSGEFGFYNGLGRIQRCRTIFDCSPVEHELWGADQNAGCWSDDEDIGSCGQTGGDGSLEDEGSDSEGSGCDCMNQCSPIVIDVDKRGFHFTGLDDPVTFDLDADGRAGKISWTQGGAGDGFLVLDRNGNGWIDDETELFGGVTPQPATNDPNGFKALAVFDQPEHGGDGDGIISPSDAIFSRLRLWIDSNHDGISQPEELYTLDTFRIQGIELKYVESRRRDRHGNQLRWASLVHFDKGRRLAAVDVIFLAE